MKKDIFSQMSAPDNQIIVASDAFYEKIVIFLTLDGFASEEGIQRVLEIISGNKAPSVGSAEP